jgi:hypothetical protein
MKNDPDGQQDSGGPEPDDAERSRFARFAKKLVQVPKEIDEKAAEWKRDRNRKR